LPFSPFLISGSTPKNPAAKGLYKKATGIYRCALAQKGLGVVMLERPVLLFSTGPKHLREGWIMLFAPFCISIMVDL
jgi:hypothetical protein